MYEEYIQNLLGMQMMPSRDTYNPNCMQDMCCNELCDCNSYNPIQCNYVNRSESIVDTEEIEKCYPEIYKVVYPMIRKACMQNTKPVNELLINELTQEIYSNIETGDIININVTVGQNRDGISSKENREKMTENRQRENKNFLLNDLIRILLIRELLTRPNRPNHMPQRPPIFGISEFRPRQEGTRMSGNMTGMLPRY